MTKSKTAKKHLPWPDKCKDCKAERSQNAHTDSRQPWQKQIELNKLC